MKIICLDFLCPSVSTRGLYFPVKKLKMLQALAFIFPLCLCASVTLCLFLNSFQQLIRHIEVGIDMLDIVMFF